MVIIKNRFRDFPVVLMFACGFFGFFIALALPVVLYAPNRPFTIPFRAITLAVSLFFVYRAFFQPRSIYSGPLLYFYLAWVLIYGSRLFLYSQETTYTLHGQYEYLMMGIGMCLLPGLGFMFVWDKRRLNIALCTVAIVGSLANWAYCWIYRAGISSAGSGRMRGGDFVGDFVAVNPLQIGYLGSALAVVSYGVLRAKFMGHYRWLLLIIMIVPSCVLVIFSNSRGPVIALIGCSLLFLFATVKRGMIVQLLISIFFIFTATAGLVFYAIASGSVLLDRFVNTYHGFTEGGLHMSRLDLIRIAIEQGNMAPVFGEFVEIRSESLYPHNYFIEAYLATGIVGLSVFVPLMIGVLIIAFKLMRNYPSVTWVSLLFFHYFFYAMFSSALYSNSYFWCSLGLLLGVWQAAKFGQLNSPN